jgi:hypothetical protein
VGDTVARLAMSGTGVSRLLRNPGRITTPLLRARPAATPKCSNLAVLEGSKDLGTLLEVLFFELGNQAAGRTRTAGRLT